MILIYSVERDVSTNAVIDWLNFYEKKWKRINFVQFGSSFNFTFDFNKEIKVKKIENNSDTIYLTKIKAIWLRKSNYNTSTVFPTNFERENINKVLKNMELEKHSIRKLLNRNLCKKEKWLNHFESTALSKTRQLETATKSKLNIAPTIITTNKLDLINFRNIHKKIIIKQIESFGPYVIDGKTFAPFTAIIDEKFIHDLKDTFFPILCQKYIDKEYEIRSFYIDNCFYSTATFTQREESTKIDSRNYQNKRPRIVPFKLNRILEKKLKNFMDTENLNCCSFDLIKCTDNKIYFLEVNPVGQFGMVSSPCNYYLEKKIAETLIKISYE